MKKLDYNSPVVLSLFFLSAAALLLGTITNGWTTQALFSVYRSSPVNPLTYVRLVGHVLGHADLEHFLGNMLLLLVIGPPLEEKYGSGPWRWAFLSQRCCPAFCTSCCFPVRRCWEPAALCL